MDRYNKNYRINPEVIDSELNNAYYLLNLSTGKYLKLNSSAKYIFKFIKEGFDQDHIIKNLVCDFNLSQTVAIKDFEQFVSKALDLELIQKTDENST